MKGRERVKEGKSQGASVNPEGSGKGSLKVDRRAGVWLYVIAALLVLGLVSNVVRIVVSGRDVRGEKSLKEGVRELGQAVKGTFSLQADSLGVADTAAVAGVDSLSVDEEKVIE
jgi:hypothetical protein